MSILLVAALAAALSQPDTLSDDALVAYASRPYDKAQMMNRHDVLGIHHGVQVVADYPCSDLCPTYTVRIIHYAVPAGPDCAKIGGRSVERNVPVSIAMMRQAFCVPAVLAEKKLN